MLKRIVLTGLPRIRRLGPPHRGHHPGEESRGTGTGTGARTACRCSSGRRANRSPSGTASSVSAPGSACSFSSSTASAAGAGLSTSSACSPASLLASCLLAFLDEEVVDDPRDRDRAGCSGQRAVHEERRRADRAVTGPRPSRPSSALRARRPRRARLQSAARSAAGAARSGRRAPTERSPGAHRRRSPVVACGQREQRPRFPRCITQPAEQLVARRAPLRIDRRTDEHHRPHAPRQSHS